MGSIIVVLANPGQFLRHKHLKKKIRFWGSPISFCGFGVSRGRQLSRVFRHLLTESEIETQASRVGKRRSLSLGHFARQSGELSERPMSSVEHWVLNRAGRSERRRSLSLAGSLQRVRSNMFDLGGPGYLAGSPPSCLASWDSFMQGHETGRKVWSSNRCTFSYESYESQ